MDEMLREFIVLGACDDNLRQRLISMGNKLMYIRASCETMQITKSYFSCMLWAQMLIKI